MARSILAKPRHNTGNNQPSNKVCILRPENQVMDVGVLGEGHHRHAGGVWGFFDCDGDLVTRWPRKMRLS